MKLVPVVVIVAALAGVVGAVAVRGPWGDGARASQSAGIGNFSPSDEPKPAPAVTFRNAAGAVVSLADYKGKVVVVNFWATWCAPCREEIPALMKVQAKYASNGVKIVGIAFDNVDKIRDYAKEMRIDYVLLIGGVETLSMAKDLGNRAEVLPFTVVLDRAGKVARVHAGALTEASLGAVLVPLLAR